MKSMSESITKEVKAFALKYAEENSLQSSNKETAKKSSKKH